MAFSVAGYPAPSRTEDDPDRYRAASDDGEGGPGLGEQEAAFPQLATLRVRPCVCGCCVGLGEQEAAFPQLATLRVRPCVCGCCVGVGVGVTCWCACVDNQ